jgi:hypothetical protein
MKATKVFTILGLGSLAVIGAFSQDTLSHAFAAATEIKPERFTELAFKDSLILPSQIVASTPQHVKGRIANYEGATIIYPYRVKLTENGVTRVLQTGRVVLVNNQTALITAPFTIQQANADITLSIELPDQLQTISFRTKS